MSRYIDIKELTNYPIRIDHYDEEHGNLNFILGIESVIEYAENLPTIDIVRCKECAVFDDDNGWCDIHDSGVDDDDYCSYGERRE